MAPACLIVSRQEIALTGAEYRLWPGLGPFGFQVRGTPGIFWSQEVRDAMSDPEVHVSASRGATLERSSEDVLNAARPLPPDEDVVIEDLSDEEDRLFLAAILAA